VKVPGNGLVESRAFEDAWTEGEKPLTVYLGIRRLNEAGENVRVLPNLDNLAEVGTRLVTTQDTEEIVDLHQAGRPAQIKRLYYLLKIFFETETDQHGDYDLIPLARLERSGDSVMISEQFIAPCLNISVSSSLFKIVSEIRDEIGSRGNQLEAYKRTRGIHTTEFGARDMVYLLALRSLNRYTPLLSHLLESNQVHPWAVYGLIKQLIGELSSFSASVTVMGETEDPALQLPKYDHRNLWECFSKAQALIIRLLDEITAGPEYIIQLLYDGTYYSAELEPAIFEGRNRYYLVMETEEDPQSVITALETIAKLGSRETLPILIARALSGIGLQHLTLPPQELPRRAHCIYFQIEHQSDQWAQVQQGHNLALYWDTAPQDLKIELMIVGRS
jgi:type VI secretion system protein ImpJ